MNSAKKKRKTIEWKRLRKRHQRTFHAKMGTIKDRKSMDLTEAEDIKKGWLEYTEDT